MESLGKYVRIVICIGGMYMSIHLIYFSGTGSTQEVVRFIGKQWDKPIQE